MHYCRMPIEVESPEELGYSTIKNNLAESSVRDRRLGDFGIDLSDLLLSYGEHRGNAHLRQAIVADAPQLHPDQVLVCPGAATALFMVHTTLLRPDNHLIVIRPNYATNLETPRAIGCQVTVIDLSFEEGFVLDPERIRRALRPNTVLISITSPQNPTGVVIPAATILELAEMAAAAGCYLLVDETYRYLNFQTTLTPWAATLSPAVISVCSFSKAFGAPGIRIGWLLHQQPEFLNRLLAAKEQIIITNSVVDEAIALGILQQKAALLAEEHRHIRENFTLLQHWMEYEQDIFEWVMPTAGVVCFPRFKTGLEDNTASFYKNLYEKHHTLVGAGHWFERDDRYFRLGFGFPAATELKDGLACLVSASHR